MSRVLPLLALVVCLLSASSCHLFKKQLLSRRYSPAPIDKNADVFIGVVESVNPEQKFVLVRTEMRIALPAGTRLESRAASGAKASLVVTPEHKMNFLSADIAEGSPAAGDVVVMPANAAAALPAQSTAPTASGQSPSMMLPDPGEPVLRLPTQ